MFSRWSPISLRSVYLEGGGGYKKSTNTENECILLGIPWKKHENLREDNLREYAIINLLILKNNDQFHL